MAFLYSSTNSSSSNSVRREDVQREDKSSDEFAKTQMQEKEANKEAEALRKDFEQEIKNLVTQERAAKPSGTNIFSTVSTTAKASGTNFVNTVSIPVSTASTNKGQSLSVTTNSQEDDLEIPPLEGIHEDTIDGIFTHSSYDDEGAVADFTNLETVMNVSPIPTSRINPSHPSVLILGDPTSAVQTRSKVNKSSEAHAFVSYVQKQRRNNHKDFHHCLFACFLSQHEPKKISETLEDKLGCCYASECCSLRFKKFDPSSIALWEKRLSGTKQEEGIDFAWVFAPVAQAEPKDLFRFASYMGFLVYQMDVKMLRIPSTHLRTQKPLVKDEEASDVDVHLYRSMIGSLMYVTASRPDIMFAVCACSRFQVTPKTSHLSAVKRIFRYLKGKPSLGLWYPRESSFDLESYSDSDYAGANLDRKSTTRGCQFLGRRLITWQCKKQTIVATSTTEAEYVAAASCCGQVLWIQNQMLDYGFNFMNTKIYIDNESTICIVKNPVYHSKTKHIAIRHHFIRDAYEKKLIQPISVLGCFNRDDKSISYIGHLWIKETIQRVFAGVVHPTKRRVYVMFDNKEDAYHWSGVCQLEVMLVNALRRFRESLRRVTDGAEAFLILTLFILCLDKVSTDHAKLVPLGKVCTAKESLEKNTAKGTKCKLEPLISLTDDLSLLSKMAALESCPKHNMIAYLEKTEGNVEFHEVIDFLRRSYISHALTVSPVVSTTFFKQFWTSAKSIQSQSTQLASISVPLDHFLVNSLTSKVFSFMIKKGKHFSGKVTPLFDTMLVQPTQDEGASTERLSVEQSSPSPAPTGEVPNESLPSSSSAQPKPSGENLEDHSSNDTSLSGNEDEMTLQNVYDLCICLCRTGLRFKPKNQKLLKGLRSQSKDAKQNLVHKKSVSKQGRKVAKGESTVQRDPQFDEVHEDKIDQMEKENAQVIGSRKELVPTLKKLVLTDQKLVLTVPKLLLMNKLKVLKNQVKGTEEQREGIEEIFEGTEEQSEGTEEKVESTDDQIQGTEDQDEDEIATQPIQTSTQTPNSMIFGDDETIATLLLNMSQAKAVSKEKEKGVELKDVEDIDRPRPTSIRSLLTLKPLLKIDPKDKVKKKIEEEDESESEDDDIPQAEKKFKQLESNEELARKVQEEWEAKEERNRVAEEQAANQELIKDFDDIKERIEADRLLAEKLQEQEREQYTIEE
ncbi:hypothetical protein Tco_0811178, partial [Tanacetum coccineum]